MYKTCPYHTENYNPSPSPHYTQWWYFDGQFDNGFKLMTCFLPAAFASVEGRNNGRSPTLNISIISPDGEKRKNLVFFPDKEFNASRDELRVEMGNSGFRFDQEVYHLWADIDKLGYDLKLKPLLPPWPPLPGKDGFVADWAVFMKMGLKKGDAFFHYAPFVPKGEMKGALLIDGKRVEVEGLGYHEQGRLNIPLRNAFERWYWMRLFLSDYTFYFAATPLRYGPITIYIRVCMICKGQKNLYTGLDVTGRRLRHWITRWRNDEHTNRRFPDNFHFQVKKDTLFADVTQLPKTEIDMTIFNYFDVRTKKQPVWLQFLTDVEANIKIENHLERLTGEGVLEVMLTGG